MRLTIIFLGLVFSFALLNCTTENQKVPTDSGADNNVSVVTTKIPDGTVHGDGTLLPQKEAGTDNPKTKDAKVNSDAASPWPDDPGLKGACNFTTLQEKVKSSIEQREIAVTIFIPEGRPGPYPIVLMTPGMMIDANNYSTIAKHLASWCYLPVLTNYKNTAFPATPDSVSIQDMIDTLNWVKAAQHQKLKGQVDAKKVALLGHSRGGKLSFYLTAQNPAMVNLLIALDPVEGQMGTMNTQIPASITVPTLVMGERFSGENGLLGQFCAPIPLNYQKYYEALPKDLPSLEISFKHAYHMSWLDNPNCGMACMACVQNNKANHQEVRSLTGRYAVAWLERFFRNRTDLDPYLWGDKIQLDVTAGAISYQKK